LHFIYIFRNFACIKAKVRDASTLTRQTSGNRAAEKREYLRHERDAGAYPNGASVEDSSSESDALKGDNRDRFGQVAVEYTSSNRNQFHAIEEPYAQKYAGRTHENVLQKL